MDRIKKALVLKWEKQVAKQSREIIVNDGYVNALGREKNK